MVNTFVVLTGGELRDPSYEVSAHRLDTRRLRKQVVEAFQIYKALYQAEEIARLRGMQPLPSSASSPGELYVARLAWLKRVVSAYNNSPLRYVRINGALEERPKDAMPLKICRSDVAGTTPFLRDNGDGTLIIWLKISFFGRVRLPKGAEKTSRLRSLSEIKERLPEGARIVASADPSFNTPCEYDISRGRLCVARGSRIGIVIPRNQIALPEDLVFTLGYISHTATRMWVGCLDALRLYIDAHLRAYSARMAAENSSHDEYTIHLSGYGAIHHEVPSSGIEHPWWISKTPAVLWTHFSSLLSKEPTYYGADGVFSRFKELAGKRYRYIWPSHLTSTQIDELLELGDDEISASILEPYLS